MVITVDGKILSLSTHDQCKIRMGVCNIAILHSLGTRQFQVFFINDALHRVSTASSQTLLNQWGSFISCSTFVVHLENVGSNLNYL